MEVRKRLLALAAVMVTMTIVTSADSSVVDLTQLLEAAGRTSRQAATCSFQYPTSNPCQQIGRTQDRFPYPSSPDMFIQCHHNSMYLTICPPSQPYYDESLRDCTTTIRTRQIATQSLFQCGLLSDPCTSYNLYTLSKHAFACPNNPTRMYLQCDAVGAFHFITCPTNEVFSLTAQSCVAPRVAIDSVGLPIGIAVTTNFDYPCTAANIANQLLRHPYEGQIQYYILCNEWGTGYLETCEPGYFNSQTSSCVGEAIPGRK